ncbi:MAG: MBL fold metallo-hydrolase [Pseudomonadota bacterium]
MLYRIGEVEIWRVLECVSALMPIRQFFPTLTDEDFEAHRNLIEPHGMTVDPDTGEHWIVLPVQAFLLRTPHHLVLVDACVGNHKTLPTLPMWNDQRSSRFMAALTAAGARPEDVTHVMCTHLHVDHVGWTTQLRDGRWVPTFPNAKVMATQADLDHARTGAETHPDLNPGHIWRQTIQPLLDADLFEVVESDHGIGDAIRFRPTPGHTPGHVSVEIALPHEVGAVVTGDLIHSPIQCALPEMSPRVDFDKTLAAQTRRQFLGEAAESRQLMLSSHFPLPSVGRIDKHGEAFRWQLFG